MDGLLGEREVPPISFIALPRYMVEDILNRLEDARIIAKSQLVCKDFVDGGNRVRSLRFIVLDIYHERARNIDLRSLQSSIPAKSSGGDSSSSQDIQDGKPLFWSFKEQTLRILGRKSGLVQVRIEVEEMLQSEAVAEGERRRNGLDELTSRLHALVVLANEHLYFVYLDLSGSKAGSSGSLEYRDNYISIILFLGSYVWIKSREVVPKGVYRRLIRDKQGRITHKYEPRFKPPRKKAVGSSKSQVYNWIYLGQFDTCYEAEVVYRIAAFYYGKDLGRFDLGNGRFFSIPGISEEGQSLCGTAKVDWVKVQVKTVYEDLQKEKLAVRDLPPPSPGPEQRDGADLVQERLDQQESMDDTVNYQGNQFNWITSQFQHANQTPNAGMNIAMQGQLERLTLNPDNGYNLNTSDHVGLLQMLVNNQQHLIHLQHQNSCLQHQILELQQQQQTKESELQVSELQNLQLRNQIVELQQQLQQQQLQQHVQEFNVQSSSLPQENVGERMIPQNHTISWPYSAG